MPCRAEPRGPDRSVGRWRNVAGRPRERVAPGRETRPRRAACRKVPQDPLDGTSHDRQTGPPHVPHRATGGPVVASPRAEIASSALSPRVRSIRASAPGVSRPPPRSSAPRIPPPATSPSGGRGTARSWWRGTGSSGVPVGILPGAVQLRRLSTPISAQRHGLHPLPGGRSRYGLGPGDRARRQDPGGGTVEGTINGNRFRGVRPKAVQRRRQPRHPLRQRRRGEEIPDHPGPDFPVYRVPRSSAMACDRRGGSATIDGTNDFAARRCTTPTAA